MHSEFEGLGAENRLWNKSMVKNQFMLVNIL